jgi:hypothetical protein
VRACALALLLSSRAQEIARLRKRHWLSARQGRLWSGSDNELQQAYQSASHATTRRVRARGDAQGGRARNADAIFVYSSDAFRSAACIDGGNLGDKKPRRAWSGHPATPADSPAATSMCTYCGALLYPAEAAEAPTIGPYATVWCGGQLCCCNGAVTLERVEREPAMEELWADATKKKTLIANARQLNNAMALASSYAAAPDVPGSSSWRPAVSIEGKLHHRMGVLLHTPSARSPNPAFAQLYVHDPATPRDPTALRLEGQRFEARSRPEQARIREVLATLHRILTESNPYVQDVRTAGEIFHELGDRVSNATFAIGNEVCTAHVQPMHIASSH